MTVAFGDELAFLRLQARSLDRFFDTHGLGRIIVVVNDRRERETLEAFRAMRAEYGRLADRVEIFTPASLLNAPRSLRYRIERHWVSEVRGRWKAHAGWAGNHGWRMQQAFKLLAANRATADNILILDAKNHFVRKTGTPDFLTEDGVPRTALVAPSGKFATWAAHSFRLLQPSHRGALDRIPRSVTPFVVQRSLLLDLVAHLEGRFGPVDCFFARRNRRTTEFMLIFTFAELFRGGWLAVAREGLPQARTIFRSTPEQAAVAFARGAAETGAGGATEDSPIFSIHRSRLSGASEDLRTAVVELWLRCGLIASPDEGHALFDPTGEDSAPTGS